ncbi:MAG: hypothetical protein ABI210_00890 [Abditibacteriaceae bacterium]
MPFQFSESHIANYMSHDYTAFRGIVPPALVKYLCRAAEKGHQLAHEQHRLQVPRIQPIANFDLDEKPFRNYV